MDHAGDDLPDRAEPVGLRQFLARQPVAAVGTLAFVRLLRQPPVGLAELRSSRLHFFLEGAPGLDLHSPPLRRTDQPGKRH